jgi:octaprenyl-diphosphate synthase
MHPSTLTAPPAVLPALDLGDPIAAEMEEVERILAHVLKSRYTAVNGVVEHVRQYRGKRLRPALLLLAGRAGGRLTPAHPILGAVVEMIHTATLVHDDILDDATTRRHVATVNARWDNQTAVLLGDYLFTHAFHLASSVDARACRLIGAATNRVCEAEMCQGLASGNLDLTEHEYLELIEGKTAELIACCCQLGALYSGASTDMVQGLTRFGRCVGLAFQIADDLLDLEGEEREAGKSLGTDLEQRKLTLPLIRVLRHGPPGLAERVRELLREPDRRNRAILRTLLAESDGVEYARGRAEDHAAQARRELACLPPSPCRTILEAISERVVHRSS